MFEIDLCACSRNWAMNR